MPLQSQDGRSVVAAADLQSKAGCSSYLEVDTDH
jgi:hypothetical protein